VPSRRNLIEMSEQEIDSFLAEQQTLILGSLLPSGEIHLVPMWYVPTREALWCWTYARSQKAKNLSRQDTLSGLVESGSRYEELRGVSFRARAVLLDDQETVLRVGRGLYERYAKWGTAIAEESFLASAPKRVAFSLVRTRTASWDHRKLAGKY